MARNPSGSARRPSHRRALKPPSSSRSSWWNGDLACDRTPGDVAAEARMTDLLVRGGTIVTAAGSRQADLAADGGRITAIEPSLEGLTATADRVVDATGMLILPGIVDVHTHTRVATDAEPDRFFQDRSRRPTAARPTFLSFNNPGTGSSPAAERSLRTGLAEWRTATEGDSAIDTGSPWRSPAMPTTRSPSCPPRSMPGIADVEGVHGVRLPAPATGVVRRDAGHERARRDAPGPLRGPGPARCRASPGHSNAARRRRGSS